MRESTTTVTGRRITNLAVCAQRPSSLGVIALFRTTSLSTRWPSIARMAGRGIKAPSIAIATTVTPAYPNDFKNICGKNNRDARVMITVIPE